jgi:DNA polymerase-4
MDAFYAAIEIRDRPELRGRPVVVGGSPAGRGVVAAASYVAREFGIHSAMPARTALRLCPELVQIPPRHDYYAKVSAQLHDILARYTPLIEPLALDEAFLDVTASQKLWGDAVNIARRIKGDIRHRLGLSASVGVAPNKFLAKLASDLDKPDGLLAVDGGHYREFLDPLPVTRIWGVGESTALRLSQLGIRTIAQLRTQPPGALEAEFGAWGRQIRELAHGRDDRAVKPDRNARSVSHERTFAADVTSREALRDILLDLCEQVGCRLRGQHRQARTVQLKLRYADFTTLTRARSLGRATSQTRELARTGVELLERTLPDHTFAVRLLGFGVSGLEPSAPAQHELFADTERERQSRIDRLADRINERFGTGVLRRGLRSHDD